MTGTRPVDPPTKAVRLGAAKCSLKISGMPVAVARAGAHTLKIGTQARPLEDEVVEITVDDNSTQVQLDGNMYRGVLTVQRKDCGPGQGVTLIARPRNATLSFTGASPGTTVRCTAGPCPDTKPHLLDAEPFPAIPMSAHEAEISVEIKATGYKRQVKKIQVHPGTNSETIALDPLPR